MKAISRQNHEGKNSLATAILLKSLFPGYQRCIYHGMPNLDLSLSLFLMNALTIILLGASCLNNLITAANQFISF